MVVEEILFETTVDDGRTTDNRQWPDRRQTVIDSLSSHKHVLSSAKKQNKCFTFIAASLINCLAASDHIAGTVSVQSISCSSRSVLLSRVCSISFSLRNFITIVNTVIADISFPSMSFNFVSRDSFCNRLDKRYKHCFAIYSFNIQSKAVIFFRERKYK